MGKGRNKRRKLKERQAVSKPAKPTRQGLKIEGRITDYTPNGGPS